jgi:pimeloyl-ACP methyl ester carboxylesterase
MAVTPGPQRVRLPDGSLVGVWEYGDPEGLPVLAFHGTPACGIGFAAADRAASQQGIRLLAPDRPGVGSSSRRSRWTVAGYVTQVQEFAEAMTLDRFAVWGYSGGGPYAVACAALLGDRIAAAAVGAGMGEIGVWARPQDFELIDRLMTWLSTRQPRVAGLLIATAGRFARLQPSLALRSFGADLPANDREFIRSVADAPQEIVATFTEAVRYGSDGVVADYAALSGPWGLELGAITTPLSVWHGDEDAAVPLWHSRELARRVPGARLTVWPGTGHLGPLEHAAEILAALRSSMTRDRIDAKRDDDGALP